MLTEIPQVEEVQATLFQLVEDEHARLAREDAGPDLSPGRGAAARRLGGWTASRCSRIWPAHAGVCEIILDRPDALNAIDTAMAVRLTQACAELAADRQVRAIVLSAAGDRAFCVGADLKERNRLSDAGLLAQREVFRAAFGGLLALPQPVVAAVHGYALGGGCELALSCDLIVADETAVFGLPEATVGLVPGGGGTQLAQRRLGPGRAADLIFTGRRVPADEAERIGLADRLVPAGRAASRRSNWRSRSRPTPGRGPGRQAGDPAR